MIHSLETYRFFPHVAWILVVSFAIFTYTLTFRLQSGFDEINTGVEDLESRVTALENKETAKPR